MRHRIALLLLLATAAFAWDNPFQDEMEKTFCGEEYIYSKATINQVQSPVKISNYLNNIHWLKDNPDATALEIMKILDLTDPNNNEKYLYFVQNDTALLNFIYYTSQSNKKDYDISSNNRIAYLRIDNPHFKAIALTIPALRIIANKSLLLSGLDKKEDLEMVALYASEKSHSFKAGLKLKNQGHIKYVFKYLWHIKWSIVTLLVILLFMFGEVRFGLFAIPQICYILLVWRFPENAWPGLLGYAFMPYIGLVLGFLALSIIGYVYYYFTQIAIGPIHEKIINFLVAIGIAICCVSIIYILESIFFTDGLNIEGRGVPSGTHYLSDEVLSDESYWGYLLYVINGAQIILFAGAIYFTIAAFFQSILEDSLETLHEYPAEFFESVTS